MGQYQPAASMDPPRGVADRSGGRNGAFTGPSSPNPGQGRTVPPHPWALRCYLGDRGGTHTAKSKQLSISGGPSTTSSDPTIRWVETSPPTGTAPQNGPCQPASPRSTTQTDTKFVSYPTAPQSSSNVTASKSVERSKGAALGSSPPPPTGNTKFTTGTNTSEPSTWDNHHDRYLCPRTPVTDLPGPYIYTGGDGSPLGEPGEGARQAVAEAFGPRLPLIQLPPPGARSARTCPPPLRCMDRRHGSWLCGDMGNTLDWGCCL